MLTNIMDITLMINWMIEVALIYKWNLCIAQFN